MTQANHATVTKPPTQGAAPQPQKVEASRALDPTDNGAHPLSSAAVDAAAIDELFKQLKTLLNTVEKLQKARHDVGDIKPLVVRLLDGELLSGEDLEELKAGVGGLSKLLKLYGDYQAALDQAQPARALLDQVLK